MTDETEKSIQDRSESDVPESLRRYSRQIRFPGLGVKGQQRLQASSALLVGCGALGSIIASTLTRAGVGRLRIADRDFLELNNLQRQSLYDENDVAKGLPKAIAASEKLRLVNSAIHIEPHVTDVTHENVLSLVDGMDLIVDGTDNFETRFLINDVSVKQSLPWVFGGCLGCDGQSMTIVPGKTPCLNCLMLDGPPNAASAPTCDSFGILAPIINVIGSLQSMEAIKILSGNVDKINRRMTVVSLWDSHIRQMDVTSLLDSDCPTCKQGNYHWLEGNRANSWAVLCGRNAVQLSLPDRQLLDFEILAERLKGLGDVSFNPFMLRFKSETLTLTAFKDGRAIINGTEDIAVAKKMYHQYLGS